MARTQPLSVRCVKVRLMAAPDDRRVELWGEMEGRAHQRDGKRRSSPRIESLIQVLFEEVIELRIEIDQGADEILSLAEAAEQTPWSKTTLYRVAEKGDEDSPFTKVKGKWVTTRRRLFVWVENARKPRTKSIGNPMPMPRRSKRRSKRKGDDFMAEVERLEREQKG
jgi:hypothetical protein